MNSNLFLVSKHSAKEKSLFLIVSILCGIVFLGLLQVEFIIASFLILLSLNFRVFWLVVFPVLIVYAGLEKTVFVDRQLYFDTPLNSESYPDLWLSCFVIRALGFSLFNKSSKFNPHVFLAAMILFVVSIIGSITFLFTNTGLPLFNKAPIKIVVFIIVSSVILAEIKEKDHQSFIVWKGFVFGAIVGAFLRIPVVLYEPTKDPGVYTFTGVFVSSVMVYFSYKKNRQLLCFFWLIVLFLHFSVSRTEIVLFSLSFVFLLMKIYKTIPVVTFIFILLSVLAINFLPGDIGTYLQHKLNFFASIGEGGGGIGDSASVRVSTFLNLIFGHQVDFFNLIFGRGYWGYLDFQTFPDLSIYTENSFSDYEHKIGKYFHLHFFLNELIFYFGFIGVVLLSAAVFRWFVSINSLLEISLIIYFIFNFMFRLELLVIVPVLVFAFRKELNAIKGGPCCLGVESAPKNSSG
ncbi:hypothetical protein [Halomonas sp.]|uniref:hypothetical protein n=1 Tax=Halomonas sp. TaxID=1486246 RepID=UPI00257B6AEE|nr:hypothetical protein [Halomonas sp.]MCJ8286910.1 hypothetical protein [Halomonas sp.]NQY71625.1 hypothetical protein [Halomonas sp.]